MSCFFFFNDTATTEIYTLSLHDALPIYFPEDFLLVIDESHVTVPQIGGMYEGDMSRKRTLVDHGFRLPSAIDNRPLKWEEFLDRIGQTVYLSADRKSTRLNSSHANISYAV